MATACRADFAAEAARVARRRRCRTSSFLVVPLEERYVLAKASHNRAGAGSVKRSDHPARRRKSVFRRGFVGLSITVKAMALSTLQNHFENQLIARERTKNERRPVKEEPS